MRTPVEFAQDHIIKSVLGLSGNESTREVRSELWKTLRETGNRLI